MGGSPRLRSPSVPLTPDQFAGLIRLQGAAEELQASARRIGDSRGYVQLTHIGRQLSEVIERVRGVVGGDERLSTEFAELFEDERDEMFWRDVEPRASALVGWLRGAVAAESFQARLDAEARAYAEARVRAERGIGFRAPE